MKKEKTFKAGVLIIGSLFWDNSNGRRAWREHTFGENFHRHKQKIQVPLRYARNSDTRECPTMTFSAEFQKHEKLGAGLVLPFKNSKLSFPEIICEARNLSEAEGTDRKFIKGKSKWCVILHWANPKLKKENEQWSNFQSLWSKNYDPKLEDVRDQFKCNCEDEPVFDDNGELRFEWPDELNDFDLILTTQPKPTDCFSVDTLSDKFFKKPEYFIKNRLNGIKTADDNDIIKQLNKKDPDDFRKNAEEKCTAEEVEKFIEMMEKC